MASWIRVLSSEPHTYRKYTRFHLNECVENIHINSEMMRNLKLNENTLFGRLLRQKKMRKSQRNAIEHEYFCKYVDPKQ